MAKKEVRLPPHLQQKADRDAAAASQAAAAGAASNEVKFRRCPLFDETYATKVKQYPQLAEKLLDFKQIKSANKLAPYNGTDRAFSPTGYFIGLRHAHLMHDVSIIYTLEGAKPTMVNMYGLFSHDELGMGTPPAIRTQDVMAKRIKKQQFA